MTAPKHYFSVGSIATRMLVIVAVFWGVTFLAYAVGIDPSALQGWTDDLYASLNPHRFGLLALRWCVFFALWWYWPVLVMRCFPESLPRYEARRTVMLGLRHRVFVVLALVELCLQLARH